MKFVDWTNITPPSSPELTILQEEYILIAKPKNFIVIMHLLLNCIQMNKNIFQNNGMIIYL